MVDMLVKNGTIITMDNERRIIRDGTIVIDDGLIVDVGAARDMKKVNEADNIIDASGKIVLPGLINTHFHSGYTLIRGLGPEKKLADSLRFIYPPYVCRLAADDCYLSALLGYIEMIKSGITCVVENNYFIADRKNNESIARSGEEVGLRLMLAPVVGDIAPCESLIMESEEVRVEIDKLVKNWHGAANGRIQIWIMAGIPGIRETPERCEEIRGLADKYRLGITCHFSEDLNWIKTIRKKYGYDTHTEFLQHHGLLGSDVLVSHAVWVTGGELELLKKTNTKVSHDPIANMYLGDGIAPIPRYIKAVITVSLGSDSVRSGVSSDMFQLMRFAALLQKGVSLDPGVLNSAQVLEMATRGGAEAVGMESQIGSLEQGKRADVIVVNTKELHMQPLNNIVANLVYGATGMDVETTVVDGRLLMKNRKIESVDEADVTLKARMAAKRLVKQINESQQLDNKISSVRKRSLSEDWKYW
jgi:5-methylthioadenosine/S-adenosylhomocysteine deaminase